MKNVGLLAIVALLSSILTVGVFKIFDGPDKIIIREPIRSYKASMEENLFSGIKQRAYIAASPNDFTAAARAAIPSVVYIRTVHKNKRGYWEYNTTASSGSGVIVSPNGYIVTNHHVVDNGAEIHITLDDKREFEAVLIGSDPSTDIALLKIESDDLPFMDFGNSDSLMIGEWVMAIGNPFRLESTVTAGIVSAKSRNISILENEASVESFIQTDAVVNQGNSGGALVNTNGELVGINAAIITQSGKYEGYSFAIPSNLAQKVIADLREYGEVRRGLLGVVIKNMTDELAKRLALDEVRGVYIDYVNPNSAAKKAGLQEGDVIVGINQTNTNTFPQLQEMVARFRPGDRLEVEYIREATAHTTDVVLQQKIIRRLNPTMVELGFELKDLSEPEIEKYGEGGAKVNSIYKDSKIMDTNMQLDFIITSVNGNKVKDVDETLEAITSIDEDIIELGGFYPQFEGEYFYAFRQYDDLEK
ncbi:MAG: trypsin-like peptidase domain-containing protein [Saprospiraceae bacterium]|nr:trypsin-like peptidase domain-containing protein [Saprospiraceae bacterium]